LNSVALELGDAYVRRARLAPALLASAPLLGLSAFWPQIDWWAGAVSIASFLGLFLILTELVRTAGKSLERTLLEEWGGFPTTCALRTHGSANPATTARRRAQLEHFTGMKLADEREEVERPRDADENNAAVVSAGITKLRRQKRGSALLVAENTSYGFRRNLRAIKLAGLSLLGISATAALVLGVTRSAPTTTAVLLCADIVAAAVWIVIVRKSWIERQAKTFSHQFFIEVDSRD
jgi:hypothetical protein